MSTEPAAASSTASHRRFADKYRLPFTLVSDSADSVRTAYRVPKTLFVMPGRTTFVIDRSGTVRMSFTLDDPDMTTVATCTVSLILRDPHTDDWLFDTYARLSVLEPLSTAAIVRIAAQSAQWDRNVPSVLNVHVPPNFADYVLHAYNMWHHEPRTTTVTMSPNSAS